METLQCPNCYDVVKTAKALRFGSDKLVTCQACSQQYALGAGRELGLKPIPPELVGTGPFIVQSAHDPASPTPVTPQTQVVKQIVYVQQRSVKSRSIAIALALLLGGLGLHHFYLDRPKLGVLYILFCWSGIPLFIGLIEGFAMLCTSQARWNQLHN